MKNTDAEKIGGRKIIPIFEAKAWPEKKWTEEQEADWKATLEELGYDK